MPKTKIQPVMLGTLKIGDQFIHDNVLWEVLQQEYAHHCFVELTTRNAWQKE